MAALCSTTSPRRKSSRRNVSSHFSASKLQRGWLRPATATLLSPGTSIVQNPLDLSTLNLEHRNVRPLSRQPAPVFLLRQKSLIHSRYNHISIARENL